MSVTVSVITTMSVTATVIISGCRKTFWRGLQNGGRKGAQVIRGVLLKVAARAVCTLGSGVAGGLASAAGGGGVGAVGISFLITTRHAAVVTFLEESVVAAAARSVTAVRGEVGAGADRALAEQLSRRTRDDDSLAQLAVQQARRR